jgi:hypothetical protein
LLNKRLSDKSYVSNESKELDSTSNASIDDLIEIDLDFEELFNKENQSLLN